MIADRARRRDRPLAETPNRVSGAPDPDLAEPTSASRHALHASAPRGLDTRRPLTRLLNGALADPFTFSIIIALYCSILS